MPIFFEYFKKDARGIVRCHRGVALLVGRVARELGRGTPAMEDRAFVLRRHLGGAR